MKMSNKKDAKDIISKDVPIIPPKNASNASSTVIDTPKSVETKEIIPEDIPVIQIKVADVLYEKAKQQLYISGCVKSLTIAPFYGEYTLYDKENRLIGTSKKGVISFLHEDLQTNEARVWYDAIAGFSKQYRELKKVLDDPGMDFTHITSVFLEFLDAPSAIENGKAVDSVFSHVHAIYHVNNFWNIKKKILKYTS
jgi:hypothetical protein